MLGCDTIIAAILAASPADTVAPVCVEDDWALAIARTEAAAENYLLALNEGKERFRSAFGQEAPQSALVQGNETFARASDALAELGYSAALPWVDQQEQNEMMAASIRDQVAAAGADPTSPAVAAQIEQPDVERGLLSHEFGHIWFMREVWRDMEPGNHHYGGSAPDWLDELVAVALESEELTESRWRRLREDHTSGAALGLEQFFTMPHPSAAIARQVAEERGGILAPDSPELQGRRSYTRVTTLTGEDARRVMANSESNPLTFYAMARGVLDFLQDRGGADILPELSGGLRAGASLEDWLASDGARFNLASDLTALEADWSEWMASRS